MTWDEIEQFLLDGHARNPLTGEILLPTVYDGTIMFAYKLRWGEAALAVSSTSLPVFLVLHVWYVNGHWCWDKLIETAKEQLKFEAHYKRYVFDEVRHKDGWVLVKQLADKKYTTQLRLIC